MVLDSVMPGPHEERLGVFERLGGAEARDIARRYWDGEDVQDGWERVCLPLYSRRADGDPDAQDRLARIRWNRDVIELFRRALAARFDPWPHLNRVVCPTPVMNGGDDPVATVSAARRLAAALPDGATELHVLPGTGHGVFREDPDRGIELRRGAGQHGTAAGVTVRVVIQIMAFRWVILPRQHPDSGGKQL
ncbi:alpha/beta fold hydrolase [Actinomadura formosensis]|uniref:alpha/beta fold hydrolase n=1 Tax=Actinomadura formosensis TaxID=60706 RepID=UPI000A7637DB|nr:alpha/beta hydrolase [Actinomadura formosensis]